MQKHLNYVNTPSTCL